MAKVPSFPCDFDLVNGYATSEEFVIEAMDALADEEYGVSRSGDTLIVKAGDVWVVYKGKYCYVTDTVHI